jgi:putative transposase
MSANNRENVLRLVKESVVDGATQAQACEILGVTPKSVQRWSGLSVLEDQRSGPITVPANKLTLVERQKLIAVATSAEFIDVSPHQIVPRLADRGQYLGSEATMYRVLKAEKLLSHRGSSKRRQINRPKAYLATRPCQVFSWDITYLPTTISGRFFYLYLFLDVFSRKAVGWKVHHAESAENASELITEICLAEGIEKGQLATHADNGGSMKGATMQITMRRLGVEPSYSRPSVSNDNPFSEALFKTLKHCPQFPSKPFATIEDARVWVEKFINWYNTVHLHSGISFTTPESRHLGLDVEILSKREVIYKAAKAKNPTRWSGNTRNWKKIDEVRLNCLMDDAETATPFGQAVS